MESELKVKSVKYITQLDNFNDVLMSIDWEYKSFSGTLELEKPSNKDFVELNEIDEKMLLVWLNEKIDFSKYSIEESINETTPELKIIYFDKTNEYL